MGQIPSGQPNSTNKNNKTTTTTTTRKQNLERLFARQRRKILAEKLSGLTDSNYLGYVRAIVNDAWEITVHLRCFHRITETISNVFVESSWLSAYPGRSNLLHD